MQSVDTSLDNRRCIYTPCLLCGGSDFAVIASSSDIADQQRYLERFHRPHLAESARSEADSADLTDRASFTQNYDTNIVACRRCGLLCRNPHPTAKAVVEAYTGDQYDHAHMQAEFWAQLRWAREKIPLMRRLLPSHQSLRIIEVGSFVGGFLAAAQEQGWDILGVDPGDAVVRFCRDRHLPVFHGTLEQASLPSQAADAVVVWNTFDQLPNPRPLLKTIAQILKPDGLLTIRIPHGVCYRTAMAMTQGHPWMQTPVYTGLAWNNLLSFPYLYGYGLSTLDQLVGECGFIRQTVSPDTLMTSALPGTKWWVTLEERFVKMLCRGITTLALRSGNSSLSSATWLDVHYRKPIRLGRSSESDLGVPPVGTHDILAHTGLSRAS